MPKLAIPLTNLRIKAAKPKNKPYQLVDGEGMYLEIMPSGPKIWRHGLSVSYSHYQYAANFLALPGPWFGRGQEKVC